MSDSRMPSHHGVKYAPDGEHLNETMKLLYERGSVRGYQDREIPDEVLDKVLTAGRARRCWDYLTLFFRWYSCAWITLRQR